MISASHAIDMRNRPVSDLSFKVLLVLCLLSPVGMVMLSQGVSWALGPETVLLSRDHTPFYTIRLPCMRRCGDQRSAD